MTCYTSIIKWNKTFWSVIQYVVIIYFSGDEAKAEGEEKPAEGEAAATEGTDEQKQGKNWKGVCLC